MSKTEQQGTTSETKQKGAFQTIRNGAIALALFGALSIGTLGSAVTAEARVNGPRLDSLSFTCGALQDEGDRLRAEYAALGNSNPSSPRLNEILQELRAIGRAWNDACQGTFGSAIYFESSHADLSTQVSPGQATLAVEETPTPPKKTKAQTNAIKGVASRR